MDQETNLGSTPAPPPDGAEPSLLTKALTFRWATWLSELTGYLSGIALIVATLVTTHGVFVRYVLRESTIWQTETTIYLMMFVTFVGAAYGLKHHAHVGVDLLVERVDGRARLVWKLITSVLCLAVVLVVLWLSYQMWYTAWQAGHRSATAWRAPLSVAYAILPVGMLLVALQYVAMIIEGIQGLRGRIPLSEVSLMRAATELAHAQTHIEVVELAEAQEAEADARAGTDQGPPRPGGPERGSD